MADKPQFTSVRASSITGKTGSKKMDGYASGSPPDAMIPNKKAWPYNGPNVAKPSRG